jgi:hypothetical protein
MRIKKTLSLFLVLTLLIPVILPSQVFAQVFADDQDGEYYRVRTITLEDGTSIDEIVIDGPPTPPLGYARPIVGPPESMLAAASISDVDVLRLPGP